MLTLAPRPVRWATYVLLAGLALHLLHGPAGLDLGVPAAVFDTWIYNGVLTGSALVCVARAVLVRSERVAWALIGVGLISWSAADLYYTLVLGKLDEAPFPSISDAGWLLFYPAFWAALVVLMRRRIREFHASLWLDGIVAALAMAACVAALVLPPILAMSVQGDAAAVAVNLAYPVGDLLLLGLLLGALALTGWRPDRSITLIGIGVLLSGIADMSHLDAVAHGHFEAPAWADSLWPASAFVTAIAAWQPVVTVRPMQLEGRRLLDRGEATTDPLTGLRNRRALAIDLDELVVDASPQRPVQLLIFDLNGFKSYNDSYGHPAGDALLMRLAGALMGAVDGRGHAYRMGGDEFCVLTAAPADQYAELGMLTRAALTEHGDGFAITAALGTATIDAADGDWDDALRDADRRMHAEKNGLRESAGGQSAEVLLRVLTERHTGIGDHVNSVAALTEKVGLELDMTEDDLTTLLQAAALHDIGKAAVPDAILDKPGPLGADEWEFMRRHTIIGERILDGAPALSAAARLVRSSHEHFDGKGYPDQLAGAAIPLGARVVARVVAVCDAHCRATKPSRSSPAAPAPNSTPPSSTPSRAHSRARPPTSLHS